MNKKEKLFSVTTKDCKWEYYRGSGKGGQKKNKTSSAVRCRHTASGAVGQAQDARSQKTNKRLAFERMANTKEFRTWIKYEAARLSGAIEEAKRYAEREVNSNRVRVEIRKNGKWCEVENT